MSAHTSDHLILVDARAIYANYSLTMVEIGIHIFMALYGLSVYLDAPMNQRKGRGRYVFASFVITALSALSASLDMAEYFQVLFSSSSTQNFVELTSTNRLDDWKRLLSGTSFGVVVLIGDALLVYRCYIIFVDYWWVTILPAMTCLSAIVLFMLYIYLSCVSSDARPYSSASSLLIVSTNIMVTSLITFRLLRARRSLSELVSLPSKDLQLYTGVVAILIESALPLSIFGTIAAVLVQVSTLKSSTPSEASLVCYNLFTGLFYSFCTLSPHMIIFRVTIGRSFTKFPPGSPFSRSSFNFELGGSLVLSGEPISIVATDDRMGDKASLSE